MLTIRQVAADELELLAQWRLETLRSIFPIPRDQDPLGLYAANLDYLRWAVPSGVHIAAFAEEEGVTVGCGGVCLHREMPSPDNLDGRCAYLMNIYVREPFRGRGIGQAVVRWLIDQARQRGATKIYLETSRRGRPLYERLGFTDMRDYMML